jgi:hypothetical protein
MQPLASCLPLHRLDLMKYPAFRTNGYFAILVRQKFHSKDSLAAINPVSCASPAMFFHLNLPFMTAPNAFVRKNVGMV